MSKTISKNKGLNNIIVIMGYLLLNTIFASIIFINNKSITIDMITIISIIQLVSNICLLMYFKIKLFSLSNLFIIFSYILHCGHLILITFKIEANRPFDVINMVSNKIFTNACIIYILSQIFLTLGILLSIKVKLKQSKYNNQYYTDKKMILKIGLIIFLIGIFPKLYIDINKIVLYINGDYLSTYEHGVSGPIQTIAKLSEIGIMMILIGNQDNKKSSKIIFIGSIIYQIIIMMTGGRIYQTVFIISMIYIYINLIEGIKGSKLVIYILFGYIGLFFINFISEVRMMGSLNINEINKVFMELSKQSPIYKALGEFGGTMISLCYSIMFIPSYSSFNMGLTYLNSVFTVVPAISAIVPNIQKSLIFVENFPLRYRDSLGGSYLGELFFNFGFYSIILVFLVGLLIGFVDNKIHKSIRNKNWFSLSICMILFQSIMIWTRGYFSDMVREFIWISIIINIIFKIYTNKYKRINYNV